MNLRLEHLLAKCDKSDAATPNLISSLLKGHPVLPDDYLALMAQSDGIEGWVGENSYLVIYSLDQLPGVNERACTNEFAPGMFIFGSDGGGMTYAFDTRTEPVKTVEVPSEVLSWDEVWTAWDSFVDFVEALASR